MRFFMKICIDPGHSGPVEPGACAGGMLECDVVLAASLALNAILLAAGHETLLTRDADIDTDDLFFRSYLSNGWPADLFISIHANSAVNTLARGMEAFHYPDSDDGAELAAAILAELACYSRHTQSGRESS